MNEEFKVILSPSLVRFTLVPAISTTSELVPPLAVNLITFSVTPLVLLSKARTVYVVLLSVKGTDAHCSPLVVLEIT